MNIKINFKHLDHTPSLDERIVEKSRKLEKFLEGPLNLDWTCYARDGVHIAELKLLGPKFSYHAKSSSDSLYKAFDMTIRKMEKQLSKRKGRWKNRKAGTSVHDLEILDPEVAWSDYDEDSFDDAA